MLKTAGITEKRRQCLKKSAAAQPTHTVLLANACCCLSSLELEVCCSSDGARTEEGERLPAHLQEKEEENLRNGGENGGEHRLRRGKRKEEDCLDLA